MISVNRSYLLLQKCSSVQCTRAFSIEAAKYSDEKYKLLIIGAGAGGLATGSKFARKLGAKNVAIIDPAKYHCKNKSTLILKHSKTLIIF